MQCGVFNVSCQPRARVPSEAFRDGLRAAVGHSSAGKEMPCNPPRLASQATSVVVNWPPSDPVFLDICCRDPGPRPLLHARLAFICQTALLPVLRRLDLQNRVVTADSGTDRRQDGAGQLGIDSGGSMAGRGLPPKAPNVRQGQSWCVSFQAGGPVGRDFYAEQNLDAKGDRGATVAWDRLSRARIEDRAKDGHSIDPAADRRSCAG
jgi:hypothetical protein